MKRTFTLLAFVFAVAAAAQTRNLEIYWIDVEGGASTLFVSPTGESLLFDTGFPGNGDRDATRIHAAAISDRKSTRLNSSHANISYAVFCLKKKKTTKY